MIGSFSSFDDEHAIFRENSRAGEIFHCQTKLQEINAPFIWSISYPVKEICQQVTLRGETREKFMPKFYDVVC